VGVPWVGHSELLLHTSIESCCLFLKFRNLFLKFRRLGLDDAKVMSKTNLPHIRVRPAVGIGDERYLGAALVERRLFRRCRLEEESVEGTHHALTVCGLSPKAAVVSVRRRIHALNTLSPKAAVVSVRRRIHACHTLSPKASVVSVRRRCHNLSAKAAVVSVPSPFSHLHHMPQTRLNTEEHQRLSPGALYTCIHTNI
jgi:hypothetical protein